MGGWVVRVTCASTDSGLRSEPWAANSANSAYSAHSASSAAREIIDRFRRFCLFCQFCQFRLFWLDVDSRLALAIVVFRA